MMHITFSCHDRWKRIMSEVLYLPVWGCHREQKPPRSYRGSPDLVWVIRPGRMMKIPLWSSTWIRTIWNFSPRGLASSAVKMVDFPNIWQQCRLKLDGYGCWSVLPSPQTAKNNFNFSSNISHVKTCRVRVPQPTSQILPHWLPFPPNIWQGGISMSYTEVGQRETAHCIVVSSGKA